MLLIIIVFLCPDLEVNSIKLFEENCRPADTVFTNINNWGIYKNHFTQHKFE